MPGPVMGMAAAVCARHTLAWAGVARKTLVGLLKVHSSKRAGKCVLETGGRTNLFRSRAALNGSVLQLLCFPSEWTISINAASDEIWSLVASYALITVLYKIFRFFQL